MAVKVITDSTADLPPEVAEQLGIRVVPLNVHFGEETYKDGITITADEFYRRLVSSPALPTTTQPSVGEFIQVYKELEGQEVVSIHISAKLSGTINSALQAKEALGAGENIAVVDSKQVSMGLGLIVMEAARAAQQGASFREVVEEAERAIPQTQFLGLLDTLEYLQKGGRIGKAQAFLGTLLRIKPILSVRDGEAHPLERVRTRERALDRLVEIVKEYAPLKALAVIHSTTPEEAEALRQRLSPLAPDIDILMGRFGPIVGTHLGPGALGVALLSSR
jgi:DegV family protein with EDD domain